MKPGDIFVRHHIETPVDGGLVSGSCMLSRALLVCEMLCFQLSVCYLKDSKIKIHFILESETSQSQVKDPVDAP